MRRATGVQSPAGRWRRAQARLRQDRALRDCAVALVSSRLVIWLVGTVSVAVTGVGYRPAGVQSFGSVGNALLAPLTGWDANTYVQIADHGYRTLSGKAFFPLYPLTIRVVAAITRSAWAAAALISILCLFLTLYLIHRLASLELGARYGRAAMLLVAFAPMSVFFSAAYTESLFLSLSIGSFYAARLERWAWAGALGVLAAMTRDVGVLLVIPLTWLFLFGPGTGMPQPGLPETDMPGIGGRGTGLPTSRVAASLHRGEAAWIAVRNGVRVQAFWLLGAPLGLALVLAYMASIGSALAPLHAEELIWHRHTLPLGGVIHGVPVALDSIRGILSGGGYMGGPVPGGPWSPDAVARANLVDWSFLIGAVIAVVGVWRRLPVVYGLYSLALLFVAVSSFIPYEPLLSVPRFVTVIFPAYLWLAAATAGRRRFWVLLGISAALGAVFSGMYATWQWVA